MKVGILLHVYNLQAEDWEHIVWGDPSHDALGVGPKLFECMLAELPMNEITVMLYDGPSHKDDLSEGHYTKQFLLQRFDKLSDFPRFRQQFTEATHGQYAELRNLLEQINIGEPIDNTMDEIRRAAHDFADCQKVIHIAAASHAPRCILYQSQVREQGLIPPNQHWYTVASDTCFAGTHADDVKVIEPPHRADDPLLGLSPTLPQILRPLYRLPPENQRKFVRLAAAAMLEVTQPTSRSSLEPGLSQPAAK